MATAEELRADLETLKAARRSGARIITFGHGPSSRTVEYRSDAQLAAAIAAAEQELANATGARPVRGFVVRGEKGW